MGDGSCLENSRAMSLGGSTPSPSADTNTFNTIRNARQGFVRRYATHFTHWLNSVVLPGLRIKNC